MTPSHKPATSAPARPAFALRAEAAAVLTALLAYVVMHGGLVFADFQPGIQIGLVVAIACAFVASSAASAALAGVVGVAVGALIEAPLHVDSPIAVAVIAASVAAVAAFALRSVVDSGQIRKSLVIGLGVVLIVGNFWLTTATLARNQVVYEGQTLFQFLVTPPNMNSKLNDQSWYLGVVDYVKAGQPYYQAFRRGYHENLEWQSDPPNVFAVREPLLPEFLAHLPGDGRSAIWAMAALATVAAALGFALVSDLAGSGAGLIALGGVLGLYLNFTTMPFVVSFEPWAGALGLASVALAGLAIRSAETRRRLALMTCAALVAVLAVAVRELMLFVPAAGLVAAFFAPREHRRTDIALWTGALVACVAVLGVHAHFAQAIVTPSQGLDKWLGLGSLDNVFLGIANGARYISAEEWLLVVLGLLGVVGAAMQRDREFRALALVATVAPLLFFLVAWNKAIDVATGRPINYWGSIVTPLLFALAPAALALLSLVPADERLTSPAASNPEAAG
jgi:hypothetical protein